MSAATQETAVPVQRSATQTAQSSANPPDLYLAIPKASTTLHESLALEVKLLNMYIKERRKEKPVEGGALYRQRYWAYDPAVGIASDHGKYDVVPGKRNDKISVKRVPLSALADKEKTYPPEVKWTHSTPKVHRGIDQVHALEAD